MRQINFLLILFLFFSSMIQLQAQDRTGYIDPTFTGVVREKTAASPDELKERSQMQVIKTKPEGLKSSLELIDTLNFPLEGEYALYIYGGGYYSGNNSFGDKAKANIFQHGTPSLLKGVLIDFAVATSNSINIEVAAWDNTGSGGSPGSKIASASISLDDIFLDVLNDQTTYIPFETPALMTSTFYVGVILPTAADTVAIYTNTDGDTEPAAAWEQWSNGEWYPYDDENSWQLSIAHAIFPIVDSEPGLLANFFADPTTLLPGESTSFFDSSIGDPVTWAWSFEGGTPASSNVQNPTVAYAEEGLFDVTLVIGDGEHFDTLVREDYIFVTSEIPVETDTLNFPLEGIYTVYYITPNGGYICGTNLFNDLAKANYFSVTEPLKISGLLVDFVIATGGNPELALNIWNNNGNGGVPGNILASKTVPMNTIKSNIANNMMTFVAFDPPLSINHPFYAGFMLPTATGDTLVVWSNEDGDTNPGTAWDMWEDGSWVAISNAISWERNISMAIHPVVEYQTGIKDNRISEHIAVFPNPANGKLSLDLSKFPTAKGIEFMNMDGSAAGHFPVTGAPGLMEIDLSAYPAGVYLIRIEGATGTAIQKIVLH